MSASLVGSEMCIRDRRLARALPRPAPPALRDRRRRPGPRRRLGARVFPPVSYTHLTLPTICSV
eukprot:8252135-Alexandrium_andersonii.AAC.1